MVDALADTVDGEQAIERIEPTPNFRGEAVVEQLLSDLELLEDPLLLVIDDLHELHAAEALTWLELLLARHAADAAPGARDSAGAGAGSASPAPCRPA